MEPDKKMEELMIQKQELLFLAARTGCPILPVAIVNSHRAFPKGSFLPRFVSIHLRVGELIQPPKTKKEKI